MTGLAAYLAALCGTALALGWLADHTNIGARLAAAVKGSPR